MMFNYANLKAIVSVLLVVAIVWLYKDWQFQKSENSRISYNYEQQLKFDSLKFKSQEIKKEDLKSYLEFQNPELLKELQKSNIKVSRLEKIIATNFKYIDSATRSTNASNVLEGIKKNTPDSIFFEDKTKCLYISGKLVYKNDSLKVSITDRRLEISANAVEFLERKQWRFLFIKSRFLGKWQVKNKIFNECGAVEIVNVNTK